MPYPESIQRRYSSGPQYEHVKKALLAFLVEKKLSEGTWRYHQVTPVQDSMIGERVLGSQLNSHTKQMALHVVLNQMVVDGLIKKVAYGQYALK